VCAQTAVPWPPPPIPNTPPAGWGDASYEQASYDSAGVSRELSDAYAAHTLHSGGAAQDEEGAYDEGLYEQDEAYAEQDDGAEAATFAAGEVIWRAGDALDDEEEDAEEDDDEEEEEEEAGVEVGFELSEEWAARFAQTEHRRALRARLLRCACVWRFCRFPARQCRG
jgi:hypothetical protein